jgi:hypothetical protein
MSPPEVISARRVPVAQFPAERSIPFTAQMVSAVLAGSKTQTRRLVKACKDRAFGCELAPHELAGEVNGGDYSNSRYGAPGDRLWVREAYRLTKPFDKDSPSRVGDRCLDAGYPKAWAPIQYEADGSRDNWISVGTVPAIPEPGKLRPGMFMCRWLSRIDLEVRNVRIERLHNISEADAIAEGCAGGHGAIPGYGYSATPCEHYQWLWEQINGAGSWSANPWVWVVSFRRIK